MNINVSPTSVVSTGKSVTQLYADLEIAYVAYRKAIDARNFDDQEAARDDIDRMMVQPAWGRFSAIADELIDTDTADPAEILMKIKAAAASNGADCETLNDLDDWVYSGEVDGDIALVLMHIRADLHRMIGPAKRRRK
jgi:hypothetical protein